MNCKKTGLYAYSNKIGIKMNENTLDNRDLKESFDKLNKATEMLKKSRQACDASFMSLFEANLSNAKSRRLAYASTTLIAGLFVVAGTVGMVSGFNKIADIKQELNEVEKSENQGARLSVCKQSIVTIFEKNCKGNDCDTKSLYSPKTFDGCKDLLKFELAFMKAQSIISTIMIYLGASVSLIGAFGLREANTDIRAHRRNLRMLENSSQKRDLELD